MLVGRPPAIARALGRGIKFAPNQVVAHRPTKLIGSYGNAVWHKKQFLLSVCVANYKEARSRLCRDTEQLLQDASNVFDIVVNRRFFSKLAIDAVVSMEEIRRRRDSQVYNIVRQCFENLLGVATDDAISLYRVVFLGAHLMLFSKKAIILRRSRSSRKEPI